MQIPNNFHGDIRTAITECKAGMKNLLSHAQLPRLCINQGCYPKQKYKKRGCKGDVFRKKYYFCPRNGPKTITPPYMAQPFLIDIDQILKAKMGNRARYVPSFVTAWLKRIVHQDWLNGFILQEGEKQGKPDRKHRSCGRPCFFFMLHGIYPPVRMRSAMSSICGRQVSKNARRAAQWRLTGISPAAGAVRSRKQPFRQSAR